MRETIEDRIKAIADPKEQKAAKVQEALATLADVAKDVVEARPAFDIKFERPPEPILDKQGRTIGLDCLVRVYIAGVEQHVDGHRRVINLPMKVAAGTFHDEIDVITLETVQVANYREDPREALLQVLEQSIAGVPNAAGWVK